MFGRAGQLAVVDAAQSDALAGQGRLVLVTGEPGIGKSLLAQQALDRAAARGLHVARGYAVDDAGAPPLWPWQRAARHVPALASALSAGAVTDARDDPARFRLCQAMSTALADAGDADGLFLLLDDFHWADSLSVAALRHVALDLPASRVVVVVTAREEPSSAFGRAVPDLLRSWATIPVALSGLDVEAVTGWLSSAPLTTAWLPFAGDLVRLTSGNPFYIRSLTAEPPPPGSDSLDTLVTDRRALRGILAAAFLGLPPDVRRTIAVAALLAERLSPSLLAAATHQPVTVVTGHINVAVAARLLRHGPTGLSFAHALVRDAVIAETPDEERAAADAAIAAAMEATQDARLIGPSAVHWDRAAGRGASERCRDLAGRAAAIAAATMAHDESVRFARMSLRHAEDLGCSPEGLAERLVQLAAFEWAAGLLPDAIRSCEEAVDLADRCGRADLMAQAALVPQGIGSVDVSRVVDRLCRRALARLPSTEVGVRAGLLGQRAVAAAEEAVDGSADALSAQALDLAQRSGHPQTELEAVAARHLVLSYPQAIDERTRLAERAIHLGRSSTTAMGALWGHLWQADIVLQRGELARLDDVLAEIERVAQQRASPVARWHVHRLLALRASLTGAFEPARRHALDGWRIAQRVGDVSMLGMYYAFCQHLAYLRGDPDEVPRDVLALLSAAPAIPVIQAARPLDLSLRGDHEAAAAAFEALREVPDRMPLGPRWAGTVSQIGVVAALLHDAPVAERCYRLMAPCANWCGGDGGGSPYGQGSNEHFLGLMAQTYGDVATAAGHFQRALTVDIRLGARPYVGLGRLGWAECLSAEPGLADRADPGSPSWRELAGAAASEFRRLDMPGPLARAERLLAQPQDATGSPFGLTSRETEVAVLVAQALTNRQIADRLFLSVRTVESHVRSVLAKLQLTTRTELAVWVGRRDVR